ncbi:hypothetical protein RRG08_026567 [Elysia crispata]|uniref:Uncharacterized protein n=1 Tax=Elysia crispata TaxID=231223 RepID=A0AAE0Y435_9GAST|nr:hypothetical protein RRG08_026567 [Elysia crispata]
MKRQKLFIRAGHYEYQGVKFESIPLNFDPAQRQTWLGLSIHGYPKPLSPGSVLAWPGVFFPLLGAVLIRSQIVLRAIHIKVSWSPRGTGNGESRRDWGASDWFLIWCTLVGDSGRLFTVTNSIDFCFWSCLAFSLLFFFPQPSPVWHSSFILIHINPRENKKSLAA